MLEKVIRLIVRITNFRPSDSEKLQDASISVSNFKRKMLDDLYKFSFYLLLVTTVVLLIFNIGFFFVKRSTNTQFGIDNGQIVLVNMTSDAIVVGKVIDDVAQKAAKQEAVDKIKDKFDVEKIEKSKKEKEKKDKVFKAKFDQKDLYKAKIALVVRDLGLSKSLTLNTLDMKPNLTLGFTPYSMDIKNWINQAIHKGFEVLINIPMQPVDYPVNDPGPYALINNLSKGENISRFNWISMRSDRIAGYYTNEDETFSNSRSNFMPILERVKEDGRYLVFGNSSNSNGALTLSDSLKLDLKSIDNVIDTVLEEEKIRNKLLLLESQAMKKGYAIGFLNPYPISLRVVEKWMKEIDNNRVVVVPVSAIFESLRGPETNDKPEEVDPIREMLTSKPKQDKEKGDSKDKTNAEISDAAKKEGSESKKVDNIEKPDEH